MYNPDIVMWKRGKPCKQKYQMLVKAVQPASVIAQAPLGSKVQGSLGPFFKCGKEDHWAQPYPTPHPAGHPDHVQSTAKRGIDC